MDKTRFVISLTVFLLVTIALSSTATATVYNNRTGTSYTTIQEAIDNSLESDTIIVTGTYTENIQINKKITLKANGTATIQAKNTYQPTITITANSTTITGFTITNGLHGIYIQANKCKIINNKITNNHGDGTYLEFSSNNTISGNNITKNWHGISGYSSYNKISNNNINNNSAYGIVLDRSNNNTISNNNITKNWHGIYFPYYSYNNTISGNNINNNTRYGIILGDSHNNTISGNNINNNGWAGIYLDHGLDNRISGNTIKNNNDLGIYLYYSDNNKVYRNSFIGNVMQAKVESGSGNLFNLTKPTGGNYWSDYTGKDDDGDGFGDTAYIFTGGRDDLPIVLKIKSINPANSTRSVPLNKNITVTFNWNIQAGPDYNKITVKTSTGTTKAITKWISGNKLYIKATGGWNPGVKFIITIPKNAVKNIVGSMLQTDFKSSFTAAIKVKSIDPANGAVNIPKTKTITVTFSNNILKGPDYNKITVKLPSGTSKTITKWISGNKLYIKATGGWNPNTKFTVTIPKNAVKNSLGSMLATDFKSTFTTAK